MTTSLCSLGYNKTPKFNDVEQNICEENRVDSWIKKEFMEFAKITMKDHMENVVTRKRIREEQSLTFSNGCMNPFSDYSLSRKYEPMEKRTRLGLYQDESSKKTTTPEPLLKLVGGSIYLPKDDPRKPRGEDAHFVCGEENCIGVYDGVGGWCKLGIDAGEYARELMVNSVIAIHNEPKGLVNPKRVLHKAYSNTNNEGSCTACIITLTGGVLHAANVGDSGFMVIRDGKVIYKSPIQQQCFNCPYQLGKNKFDPSVVEELQFNVQNGDIIVAGTDGLFDNMHDNEIEEIICQNSSTGTNAMQLLEDKACKIANLALYNSFDKYSDTPYSRGARKAGYNHSGGKIDDITVVVAYVKSSEAI